MSNESPTALDTAARVARVILLTAIAVVTGMIVASSGPGAANPLRMRSLQAEGSVTAAPGYLVLSMNTGGAAKFFLADTTKQVICLYEVNGDKLRLVGARRFDYDADIFDGSIGIGGKSIEGGNGVSRKEAQQYGEALQKMWDAGNKTK